MNLPVSPWGKHGDKGDASPVYYPGFIRWEIPTIFHIIKIHTKDGSRLDLPGLSSRACVKYEISVSVVDTLTLVSVRPELDMDRYFETQPIFCTKPNPCIFRVTQLNQSLPNSTQVFAPNPTQVFFAWPNSPIFDWHSATRQLKRLFHNRCTSNENKICTSLCAWSVDLRLNVLK